MPKGIIIFSFLLLIFGAITVKGVITDHKTGDLVEISDASESQITNAGNSELISEIQSGNLDVGDSRITPSRRRSLLDNPGFPEGEEEDYYSRDDTNLNEYGEQFKDYAKKKYGKDVTVTSGTKYSNGKLTNPDGSTVDLKTITAATITSTPTGTQIDTDFVSGGNVWEENNILRVDNANSVTLRSEREWFIDYAKEIDAYGAKIEEVYELSAEKRIFTVKSADSVRVGCILAKNVRDSTFTIMGYALEITSPEGISYDVYYNDGEFVKYASLADGNIFTADARYCFNPSYTLKNTSINITTGGVTETIIANNTAFVEIDEFGVKCAGFTPLGFYKYDDSADITKFFALKVWKEPHKVCIRKDISQSFDLEEKMTVVDLVDKKINIDGVIELLKFHFHSLNFVDFLLHSVFRPEDSIMAELLFKPELNYLQNASVKTNSFAEVNNWLSFNDSETARIF